MDHYGLLERDDQRSIGDNVPQDPGQRRQLKIERKRREAAAKVRLAEIMAQLTQVENRAPHVDCTLNQS